MNKKQFRSRKELSEFLKTKGIDTSNWTEEKWLSLNKGQSEIHMMALAEAMWDAYNESIPKELKAGEWHIPFGDTLTDAKILESLYWNTTIPREVDVQELMIKIATARCARVSYTVVGEEGKPDNYENDIKLHDRLAASGHWSPFEHCARAMTKEEWRFSNISRPYVNVVSGESDYSENIAYGISGNFRGFIQYRKMFANENIV